jgi:AsmA protein
MSGELSCINYFPWVDAFTVNRPGIIYKRNYHISYTAKINAARRRSMSDKTGKRFGWLKAIVILAALLVIILIALPFIINANQFRPQIESKLSSALGREVKAGNLKLSLLSGNLTVDNIVIADNPEFSRSPFVTAKSLKVGIELKPLIFSKEIRITKIILDRPEITLIRSTSGKWNFSDLGGEPAAAGGKPKEGSSDLSHTNVLIKELKIVDGKVTSIEGHKKPSVYSDVNIAVENLSFATSFPFALTASLPGSSKLKLDGKAGPWNKTDAIMTPLEANLAITHFDLIGSGAVPPESGLSGLLDFSGSMTSRGGQVQSKGRATADKLQMVKAGSPAGHPVSLDYVVNYDLARQSGTLDEAKVQFGKAVAGLNGKFEMQQDSPVLNMKLRGTNMPMQDLSALLPAFGVTLPKGASLQGGMLNADLTAEGPIDKLITSGTAEISKTKLTGFDLGGKMAALATLAGIKSSQDTEIEKFTTSMRMNPEGIQVSDLLLVMPALGELSGTGKIAPDQSLDFVMRAMLKPSGGIGAGLTRLTGAINLPFFVRGSASDPKFVPDVKNAAKGLLGSALGGQSAKDGQSGAANALGDTLRGLFKKKK